MRPCQVRCKAGGARKQGVIERGPVVEVARAQCDCRNAAALGNFQRPGTAPVAQQRADIDRQATALLRVEQGGEGVAAPGCEHDQGQRLRADG